MGGEVLTRNNVTDAVHVDGRPRSGGGADATQLAEGIVAAAVGFQGGQARDDMAVVVIKVPVAA